MSDTRYQNQPLRVKLWRQTIWEPFRWWCFLSGVAVWGWHGFKPLEAEVPCYDQFGGVEMVPYRESRKELVATFWSIAASRKSMKMQYWYTTEEMLDAIG